MISFSCDARGQGRAASNVGVPVLWGRGGGSGTGARFHSPVLFRPRAVESNASARPGICSQSGEISLGFGRFFSREAVGLSSCRTWSATCLRLLPIRGCADLGRKGEKCTLFSGTYCSSCSHLLHPVPEKRVQFLTPGGVVLGRNVCGVLLLLFVGFM